MYLQQLTLKGFGSLPDQQMDLCSGMNILVDTSLSWHGRLSSIVAGALFGLADDARARLLAASDEASVELNCIDGAGQHSLQVVLSPAGERVEIQTTSSRLSSGMSALCEQAAASEVLAATARGAHPGLSGTGVTVTDLQSGYESAVQRLNAERQETSSLLDVINLESLREKASSARQIVAEMNALERELRTDPTMDRSLGDDVAAAKSLEAHIASMTKVVEMKKEKLVSLQKQLAQGRDELEFYEYLKGIGVSEVSTVKRSLERKRWLMDDLQKLETEIELGNKRLDTVAAMVMKYERLVPFLGQREMDLDRYENQLEQLMARMPTLKLQQAEAERRAVRLQIQYWRRRRLIAALLSTVPLPIAILWVPAALASLIGLGFAFKYWGEISALVQKLAVVVDRCDYLMLERNELAAQIRSVEVDIDAIRSQTGTASASELHDKIDDYKKLLSELKDLKTKAAEREKARDQLRRKLREEEQRAGVLFDRVGLSAELSSETVDKFVGMVNSRIEDERAMQDLERRIEDGQTEIEGLLRQVTVLQKRLSRILAVRKVESVSELQQLWDAAESQDITRLYRQKREELQQLLNGQRLADLEARVQMLSHLVPDEKRIAEIPTGITQDHLEARFDSIRARSDFLKWLKRSALPAVVEGLHTGSAGDLERRQVCLDLCLMCRTRQLLVLVPDELWATTICGVAGDLDVPVSTIALNGGD